MWDIKRFADNDSCGLNYGNGAFEFRSINSNCIVHKRFLNKLNLHGIQLPHCLFNLLWYQSDVLKAVLPT